MAREIVRSITKRVRRVGDANGEDVGGSPRATDGNHNQEADPVVAAADHRIRQRGLDELEKMIDQMADDPSFAPDPIDIIDAGVPEQDVSWDLIDSSVTEEFFE